MSASGGPRRRNRLDRPSDRQAGGPAPHHRTKTTAPAVSGRKRKATDAPSIAANITRRRSILIAGVALVVLVAIGAALKPRGEEPASTPAWTIAVRPTCRSEAARLARITKPIITNTTLTRAQATRALERALPVALTASINRLRQLRVPDDVQAAWLAYLADNQRSLDLRVAESRAQLRGDRSPVPAGELQRLDARIARFAAANEIDECSLGGT